MLTRRLLPAVLTAGVLAVATYSRAADTAKPGPVHSSASELSENEVLALQGPKALTPAEAIKRFSIADGLEVRLAASEPLVKQPVSITFDDRGRLWVLQYLQYPVPEGLKPVAVDEYLRTKYDRRPEPPPKGPKGRDRLTILEDTNGDGVMDQPRTLSVD